MPVSMYDPDGAWCPVDNVLVESKLAQGYTLEDPAAVKAEGERRLEQREREVKSNQDLLDELMGSSDTEDVKAEDPVVVDTDEPEQEVDD